MPLEEPPKIPSFTRSLFKVVKASRSETVTASSNLFRFKFGGIKSSGIGRDGGDWSFDFYMETKNISFATTEHKIPKLGV